MNISFFKLKDLRVSSRSRAFIYILVTSIICFGLLGLIIYNNVSGTLINQCKSDAMDIAEVAAGEINGDIFEKINTEEDEQYRLIFNILSKYEKADSISYIYTMKKSGNNLMFVVDGDTNPDTHAAFGEKYTYFDSMEPAFDGIVCADSEVTSDRWGRYFSAYAPIINCQGSVSGIVGCDIEISTINQKLNIIKIQIILQISVFFLLCVLMISSFYSIFSKKDMLTGIPNYDSLADFGKKLKKRKNFCDYSAIQINIKNFKYINSLIGSANGDILLKIYAETLCSHIDAKEYCARIGSDNFMAIIKRKNEVDFLEKLSCIRINLKKYGFSDELQVLSRCGIYHINNHDNMQDIINCTSVALKNARITGSSDFVWFEKSMFDSMIQNNAILSDFHRALGVNEFTVFYQPKVNIATNDLCGAEALVRWIKDGKVIPPSEFIPVLENEGTISELDFFVFETVCKNLCEWKNKGIKPVPISSNFSKVHLANPEFAESVLMIVEKYNISHEFLEIELTESSGYSNYEAMTKFVQEMNNAHIHTSIDDFGTGYSSLSMLKDINVDVVKIDKSFLGKSDGQDDHQEKMLENVIKMINDLDRTVICEGIETENQLKFLKQADCSIAQGYFFDKPLPHDEFELRLKNPHYQK